MRLAVVLKLATVAAAGCMITVSLLLLTQQGAPVAICLTSDSQSDLCSKSDQIPKIIHQSWRTRELEPFQREWQRSWLVNHPSHTYMFWTDLDNRELIRRDFPWFLSVYDAFPEAIQRADSARYAYMLRYGGCYVDLDFESLKPLDPVLKDIQVALAYMSANNDSNLSIPNAWMCSTPAHTFWFYVLKHIMQNFAAADITDNDVHRITGPIMLYNAIKDYRNTSASQYLTVLPAETVYGVDYNWRGSGNLSMQEVFSVCHAAGDLFNSTRCKQFFPDSYAVTYWSGDITWMAETIARDKAHEDEVNGSQALL